MFSILISKNVNALHKLLQNEPVCHIITQQFMDSSCIGGHNSPDQAGRFFMENTAPVTIIRPSSRRKFLVALLGSGAILGFGSLGLAQLAQDLQVAFHTRNYPYNSGDDLVDEDFSPDLNFMGMVKVGAEDNLDAKLYIWDYQQQRMGILPTGPG